MTTLGRICAATPATSNSASSIERGPDGSRVAVDAPADVLGAIFQRVEVDAFPAA